MMYERLQGDTMGPYDLTMKRLTSEFTEDYVRFALNRASFHAEVLEVEEVDKELPTWKW